MRTHITATCLTLIAGLGHAPPPAAHTPHRADWAVGAMHLALDPVLIERHLVGATWSYMVAVEQLEAGSPGSVVLNDSFHGQLPPGRVMQTFLPLGPEACEPGITNTITAIDPSTGVAVAGTRLAVRVCPLRPLPGLAHGNAEIDSEISAEPHLKSSNPRCLVLCIQNGTDPLKGILSALRADPNLGRQRLRVPPVLDADDTRDGCSELRFFIETVLDQYRSLPVGLATAADAAFTPLAATQSIELQCI